MLGSTAVLKYGKRYYNGLVIAQMQEVGFPKKSCLIKLDELPLGEDFPFSNVFLYGPNHNTSDFSAWDKKGSSFLWEFENTTFRAIWSSNYCGHIEYMNDTVEVAERKIKEEIGI